MSNSAITSSVQRYVKIPGDSNDLREAIHKQTPNAVVKNTKDGIFVTPNVANIFYRNQNRAPVKSASAKA